MKNKLALIITLSLAGVLVLTTILLGVIKKDYYPNFSTTPHTIIVTDEDSNNQYDMGKMLEGNQKRDYDKFVRLFKQSFKQSILAGAFSGNLNHKTVVEYKTGSIPAKAGFRVVMRFSETTIKDENDVEYNFEEIVLNLENKEGVRSLNLYVKPIEYSGYLNISTIANTKALYDFVSGLDFK